MAEVKGLEVLQEELERAKFKLKDVNENIKKLTGRDPEDQRNLGRRDFASPDVRGRGRGRFPQMGRRWPSEDGPAAKRRLLTGAFARLGNRPMMSGRQQREDSWDEDDQEDRPAIQSTVVATGMKRTRKDMMREQTEDHKGMARNKRMFGLLLGTLQTFRREAKENKEKEDHRKEIENKLEEKARTERVQLQQERKQLVLEMQHEQAKINRLEQKMELVNQHDIWEHETRKLENFICTQTTPRIFFLPKSHTTNTLTKLKQSCSVVQQMITDRRVLMEKEIEELMRLEQEREERIRLRKCERILTSADDHDDADDQMQDEEQDEGEEKENKQNHDDDDDDDDDDEFSKTIEDDEGKNGDKEGEKSPWEGDEEKDISFGEQEEKEYSREGESRKSQDLEKGKSSDEVRESVEDQHEAGDLREVIRAGSKKNGMVEHDDELNAHHERAKESSSVKEDTQRKESEKGESEKGERGRRKEGEKRGRSRDRDVSEDRKHGKGRERSGERMKKSDKEKSTDRSRDRSRERSKERVRKREGSRERHHSERKKRRDSEKDERKKSKSTRHRSRDNDERHRSQDRDERHRSLDKDLYHRSRDKDERHRSQDKNERHRSRDKDDRHTSRDRDLRHRSQDKDDRNRSRDKDDRHRSPDKNERHSNRDKEERHRSPDKDLRQSRDKDDRPRSRDMDERHRSRDKDEGHRSRDKEYSDKRKTSEMQESPDRDVKDRRHSGEKDGKEKYLQPKPKNNEKEIETDKSVDLYVKDVHYEQPPEDISQIRLPDEDPITDLQTGRRTTNMDTSFETQSPDMADKKHRKTNRWDRTTKEVEDAQTSKIGSEAWDCAQSDKVSDSQKRIQMAEDEEEDENQGVDE